MTYWNMIFSGILLSCGTKTDDSPEPQTVAPTCNGVMCYGECLESSEATYDFTLSEEEFATYLEADGSLSAEGCANICISKTQSEYFTGVDEVLACTDEPVDGSALVTCNMIVQPYCEGRFHDCVPKPQNQEGSPVQQWLARAAQSERASVQSFVLLAGELKQYHAPQKLISRLMLAAKEEVEHARMMHHLCHTHNIQVPEMKDCQIPQRSLLDIAMENAVEGCVHERYAALQAHYQAHHVQDKTMKEIFSRIAKEETEHTALADALHEWLMTQLSDVEKTLVLSAKAKAQIDLLEALKDRSIPKENIVYLGLPNNTQSVALAEELHRLAS